MALMVIGWCGGGGGGVGIVVVIDGGGSCDYSGGGCEDGGGKCDFETTPVKVPSVDPCARTKRACCDNRAKHERANQQSANRNARGLDSNGAV